MPQLGDGDGGDFPELASIHLLDAEECSPAGPPAARGALWEAVLERSLHSEDLDRILTAISLAEDGGASQERLLRARSELQRLAMRSLEDVLGSVSDGGSCCCLELAAAIERADDVGVACPELVGKARRRLQQLLALQQPAAGGETPRAVAALEPTPPALARALPSCTAAGGGASPAGVHCVLVDADALLRCSGGDGADVRGWSLAARRGGSPGPQERRRLGSPGRVAPAFLERPNSVELLEAGIAKAPRRSHSPLGNRVTAGAVAGAARAQQRFRHIQRDECAVQ